MTPEERDRLVTVEAAQKVFHDRLDVVDRKLDQLLQAAAMGRGAWWVMIRLGGAMLVIIGLFWQVIDHWAKIGSKP